MSLNPTNKLRLATEVNNRGVQVSVTAGTGNIADTSGWTEVIAGGTYDTIIEAAFCSTNNTNAVTLYAVTAASQTDVTTRTPLGTYAVPASSGNSSSALPVDLLPATYTHLPINNQGKRYFRLKAGRSLFVKAIGTVAPVGALAWVSVQALNFVDAATD